MKEKKVREPLFHIAKRDNMPKWRAWLVRIIAVVLALLVSGIVTMLLTGENQVVCPVIGVDGTRAACQAILDGQLAFTVYQPADAQGQAAVDAALALLRGEPLDAIPNAALSEDGLSLTLPYAPVDAENAAEFIEK